MLVIRMQRTGRKGHAQFRVVVQDSRRTPTSGNIVASLGHFNPHTKETSLDKVKASFYMEHGAQPSDRVARLMKAEGVKLPKWVVVEGKKNKSIRNVEKLRRNRPAGEEVPAKEEKTEAAEASEEQPSSDAEASTATEEPTEQPAEEPQAPEKAETATEEPTEVSEAEEPEAKEESKA